MCYPSCLGESIHSLSYPCIDVSIVWFFLEIVFVHRLLWYNFYLYPYILFPVHNSVQVKIFHVHTHVPLFDVWDGTVYMEFHGVQVWFWCADISWIIYNISSWSESCPMSLCFMMYDITYCSHVVCLYVLWFGFVEYELYCVCYRMFFHPWDKRPSLLHIEFFHTGASILTRYL